MGKGKKFDAAQKHFEKKQEQYNRLIKSLNEQLDSAHKDVYYFRSHYEFAEREIEELKKYVDKLLEYTQLTQEDIKAAVMKDVQLAETFKWLNTFSNVFR